MQTLRVLLVEDDQDTRDTTAVWLSRLGHQVHVASDGRTALELAQTSPPDVVLLDLGLTGIDGWEVARRLRADPSATRPFIVALTGHGLREDYRRSREAGIDLHITKPADPEELRGVLARFRDVVTS